MTCERTRRDNISRSSIFYIIIQKNSILISRIAYTVLRNEIYRRCRLVRRLLGSILKMRNKIAGPLAPWRYRDSKRTEGGRFADEKKRRQRYLFLHLVQSGQQQESRQACTSSRIYACANQVRARTAQKSNRIPAVNTGRRRRCSAGLRLGFLPRIRRMHRQFLARATDIPRSPRGLFNRRRD